jgi:ABC-type sugar transport system substrate-binding protein/anti-anti-sigma regulatory factor
MHIGFAAQDPTSAFWMIVHHGVQERIAELGIDMTIRPARSVDEQIASLHIFLTMQVDIVLLAPFQSDGLADVLERFKAAGIPVILVAGVVTGFQPACTVRSDNIHGAELAVTALVKQLGGEGRLVHLMGPSTEQDSIDRADGVHRVLRQYREIEIVYEGECVDWRSDVAAETMRDVLGRYPDIRGVCCADDEIALGAIEAIAAAGRVGKIAVTGFDAIPAALTAIHQGQMYATVQQSMRAIGRTSVEVAQQIQRGERVSPLVFVPTSLVTRESLLDAALEAVYLLPSVLQDAIARGEALARARETIIDSQARALRELSTPLIPVSDSILVMPLIGTIDTQRAQLILESLLEGVAASHVHVVILDITGVLIVDTQVASTLVSAAQAVKLLGARVMLTGVRPDVAQTLVSLGADLSSIETPGTLQRGIAAALVYS